MMPYPSSIRPRTRKRLSNPLDSNVTRNSVPHGSACSPAMGITGFLTAAAPAVIVVLTVMILSAPASRAGPEGEYTSYTEMIEHLEYLNETHPDIVGLYNLSDLYGIEDVPLTYRNRTIWAVKLSDNPHLEEENETDVLYLGAHHAREWISTEVVLDFLDYMADNYDSDVRVRMLVDEREMWIVPMVNPDGVTYSAERGDLASNGNGGWRKNLRDNDGDGELDDNGNARGDGVDLNRNYQYLWYDRNGCSTDPNSHLYRGPYDTVEDDGDWQGWDGDSWNDDLNQNGKPDIDWDGPDEDGDGDGEYRYDPEPHVNEDWVDDIDNDGDGEIDEDPAGGFTEPETAAIEALALDPAHDFRALFTYHSQGGWIMGPWGYTDEDPEDLEQMMEFGGVWADISGYTLTDDFYYSTTGDTVDWFYFMFGTFAYTVELADRFIPPEDEIEEIEEINLEQNLLMAEYAPVAKELRFLDGFEDDGDDGRWQMTGSNNSWSYRDDAPPGQGGNGGISGFYYASTWGYPDNATAMLRTTGPINLSGLEHPKLTFWHRYDFETGPGDGGEGTAAIDGGVVEVRHPERGWEQIYPVGGYPYHFGDLSGYANSAPAYSGKPAFSGLLDDWEQVVFDLSDYVGENIDIQFTIISSPDVEHEGWCIDNVAVYEGSVPLRDFSMRALQDFAEMGPGESINFTIEIENIGDTTDIITLTMKDTAGGASGGALGESQDGPGKGSSEGSGGSLEDSQDGPGKESSERSGDSSEDLQDGPGKESSERSGGSLEEPDGSDDWEYELEIDSVELKPGESARFNVTLTAPTGAIGGRLDTHVIEGKGQEGTHGSDPVHTLKLTTKIRAIYEFSMSCLNTRQEIKPGDPANYTFVVDNTGNVEDAEILVSVTSPGTGWSMDFFDMDDEVWLPTGNFSMKAHSRKNIRLTLTAPHDIEPGETVRPRVTMTMKVVGGDDLRHSVEIEATVVEYYAVSITTTAPMRNSTPGTTEAFSVLVVNEGNVEIDVLISVLPLGADWSISTDVVQAEVYDTQGWKKNITASLTLQINAAESYFMNTSVVNPGLEITPGDTDTVYVKVENLGNVANNLNISLDAPSKWGALLDTGSLTLGPGGSRVVEVSVTIPASERAGHAAGMFVNAYSEYDEAQRKRLSLPIEISLVPDFSVEDVTEETLTTLPGRQAAADILVENLANGDISLTVTVEQLYGDHVWELALSDLEFSLDYKDEFIFTVLLTPPEDAKANEEASFRVTVSGHGLNRTITLTAWTFAPADSGGKNSDSVNLWIYMALAAVFCLAGAFYYLSRASAGSLPEKEKGEGEGYPGPDTGEEKTSVPVMTPELMRLIEEKKKESAGGGGETEEDEGTGEDAGKKSMDDSLDQPLSDSSDKPLSDSTDKPLSDSTDKTMDDSLDQPLSDSSDKPLSDSSDKPLSASSDKTMDDSLDQPLSDPSDKTMDDSLDHPLSDSSDKTMDDSLDHPLSDSTDKPLSDSTDKPLSDSTDKPLSDSTDKTPDNSKTPSTTSPESRSAAHGGKGKNPHDLCPGCGRRLFRKPGVSSLKCIWCGRTIVFKKSRKG